MSALGEGLLEPKTLSLSNTKGPRTKAGPPGPTLPNPQADGPETRGTSAFPKVTQPSVAQP